MDSLLAAYNSGSDASDGQKEEDDIEEEPAKRQKTIGPVANSTKPTPPPSTEKPITNTLQRSLSQGVQDRYASKRERARERAAMAAAASVTPPPPPVHPPPEVQSVLYTKMPEYIQHRMDYVLEKSGGRSRAASCVGLSPTQPEGPNRAGSPLGWSPAQLDGHIRAGNSMRWSAAQLEDYHKIGTALRRLPTMLESHNIAGSAVRGSPTTEFDCVLNAKMTDHLPKRVDSTSEKSEVGNHWVKERMIHLEGHNKGASPVGWSPTQFESYKKAVGSARWSAAQLEGHDKANSAVQWSPTQLKGHEKAINDVRWPPSQYEVHDKPVNLVRWTPPQLKGHDKAVSDLRWLPSQLEGHNKAHTQLESHNLALNGELETHNRALRELDAHNKALAKFERHDIAVSAVQLTPTQLEGHKTAINAVPWSPRHCSSEARTQVRDHNTAGSSQMSMSQGSQLPESSAEPSQPVQLDSNRVDEEVEEGDPHSQRAERLFYKGQWSLKQLLILCNARSQDWREHGQGAPGKVAHQSADRRWAWIAAKCLEQGVVRTAQQCKDKWEQIRADFTKVYEHEKHRPSGKPSYWSMGPTERRNLRVKTVMKLEIFDHLKTWVPNSSRSLEPMDVMDSKETASDSGAATVSDPGRATTPDPGTATASDPGTTNASDPGAAGGVEHGSGDDAPLDCASPGITKLRKHLSRHRVTDGSTSGDKRGLPMAAAQEREDARHKEAIEVAKMQLAMEEESLQLERERITIAKDFAQGFIGALSAIGNAMVMIASSLTNDKEG